VVLNTRVRSEQMVWLEKAIYQNPSLASDYMADLEITEVVSPQYVTPDTAKFYVPSKDGSYSSIEYPGDTYGLVTAMRKRWLMVAPVKVETPFDAPSDEGAPSESDDSVDATQAIRELANALDQRDARDEIKGLPYGCTYKGCRRRFKNEAGRNRHFTVRHSKEN
jgi:hypothetical protein